MAKNKKNELLQCYLNALENYCKRKPRQGCMPTFFTKYRHSFKEYPVLVRLHKALAEEQDSVSALTVVINHFITNTAAFNNHSFNNYFMDELKSSESFKDIEWDCFTPKAIKHYTSSLKRGDTRPPEVIFKSGFKERSPSKSYSDYLKYYTGTIGISTSKDFFAAINYPMRRENLILKYIRALFKCSAYDQKPRYVYLIDYQGADGFDILKTGQARGLSFSGVFHQDRFNALQDKEVNVKGAISPEYIRGVYESTDGRSWLWRENPVYMASIKPDEIEKSPTHNIIGL
ncbi:hypothetical protein RVIR1_12690 [Candidatus Rickettsiella viridis]|uniref:Pierisin-like domain-containing protein n=1 Tax=Candidatus Rickettsiella viridis TaxID=676208 RepID=A0A2Z5UWA9_9COXI|nr:hypothetical protein [Candidatus Rickettsiella viridis]BBB15724.1 hypothetical protein RVIR1_12690 [Candidatus Rickettsiella viridis]